MMDYLVSGDYQKCFLKYRYTTKTKDYLLNSITLNTLSKDKVLFVILTDNSNVSAEKIADKL